MKVRAKFQRERPLFRDKPEYKSIGYARQSTNKEISIDAQVEELKKAGCLVVFQETVSSANKESTSQVNKKDPSGGSGMSLFLK